MKTAPHELHLFDTIPTPALLLNIDDNFSIYSVNESLIEEYGNYADFYTGISISDFLQLSPEQSERLKRKLTNVRLYNEPLKLKIDAVLSYELVVKVIDYPNKYLVVYLKRETYSTTQNLNGIIESIDAIIWEVDPATFEFTFISSKVSAVLGYSPKEWLTTPNFWQDHIHPDDRIRAIEFCLSQTENNLNHQFEYRMIHSSGSIVWIKDIVSIIHVEGKKMLTGVMIDITEEKNKRLITQASDVSQERKSEKSIQRIQSNNERYSYVMKATFDAIWDWDILSESVEWGEGIYTLFGYSMKHQSTSDDFWENRIHPMDLVRVKESLAYAFDNGLENWSEEYQFQRADGSYAFIIDKAIIIRDEEKNPIRMVGAMRDITERKEEELRLKLLESVIVNMNDAVVIIDGNQDSPRDSKIIYCNESMLAISEYALHELVGYSPGAFFGENTSKKTVRSMYYATVKKKSFSAELLIYTKQNKEVWLDINMNPIRSVDGKTKSIITASDITEKKYAEERKSYFAKISAAFNNELSLKDNIAKVLKIINKYSNVSKLEFWTVGVNGKNIHLTSTLGFLDQNSELRNDRAQAVFETEKIHSWEASGDDLSNEEVSFTYGIPIKVNGQMVAVLIAHSNNNDKTIRDFVKYRGLSAHLGSEIKRKQLQQELMLIVNTAPDIIALIGENYVYKKVNQSHSTFLNSSDELVDTSSILDFVHPDYMAFFKGKIDNVFSTMKSETFEVKYIIENEEKWLSWTLSSFADNETLLCIAKNVTSNKTAEIELKSLYKALDQHAKKLARTNAELEQFAYIASHDLQEPLRMISNFLSLLEKKYDGQLDDKAKQYIYFAVDGATRMRQIILDLLNYSRISADQLKMENVVVGDVMEEIKILFSQQICETNAKLIYTDLPTIKSHKAPIRQLFQNLISNSVKYKREDVDPLIEIDYSIEADHHVFTISDNGIGIPEKYSESVFQLFHRLHPKNEYSGTGLGLSIAKKIVENYGGEIWISKTDRETGTQIQFTLPINSTTNGNV